MGSWPAHPAASLPYCPPPPRPVPQVYRESFSKYFSMDHPESNEVKWTPADTGTLIDVPALQAFYAKKGGRVCVWGGGS